jgi:uncharacterized membrane protein YhaH (DUF805 family)
MFKTYTDTIFNNYGNFTGKVSRKTYLLFLIENFAVIILIIVILLPADSIIFPNQDSFTILDQGALLIYGLAVLLPFLGLEARRLHDVGLPRWPVSVSLISWAASKVVDIFTAFGYTNIKSDATVIYHITATIMFIIYLQPSKKEEKVKIVTIY